MTKPYDYPSLTDLDLEIEDAAGLARGLSSGESLYVTYVNGKYALQSRNANWEWDFHFKLSQRQAREIVKRGIAAWNHTVADGVK